jgi:type I restriction-modification system DNA methylase subunit
VTKEESKQRIEQLVRKFEGMPDYLKKDYNEEQTKKNLILPLFEALGWDIQSDEVQAEESASGGRVDYAFKLNGITKLYAEAKPIRANLADKKYHDQLVEYGYNKDVTWGVLTDFEELKIFNTLEETPSPISFSFKDYIKDFDILWLLSKDSFQNDEINKLAERLGLKTQPVPPVGKQLADDLIKWRDGLTTFIKKWHTERPEDQINEDVQKFLDRLIFIRVAEDRGLEDSHLLPLVHDYKEGRKTDLTAGLNEIFREFDKKYDSNLFRKHSSEDLDLSGIAENVIKIIQSTYATPRGKRYNFSFIDADILGEVYQQYIGTVQSGGDKNSTRKKQGIYYTPRFIVDYIVENTLGSLLKEVTSQKELESIKVLDPAVGSGSFLIKAFDVLEKIYEKADVPEDKRRETILKNNLFGVDLDPQAVEIAQLNLLLVSAKKRELLPMLDENIKVGNSLISGGGSTLKQYFGENWKEQKPFNWEGEFKEITDDGGFDVIVGNPPWISNDNLEEEQKKFFDDVFETAISRYDIACLFVERALSLLKKNGYLGFVVPEHIWIGEYFVSFREFLENRTSILKIVSLKEGAFKDVANPASLFICRKKVTELLHQSPLIGKSDHENRISLVEVRGTIKDRVIFETSTTPLVEKIEELGYNSLGNLALVTDGIQTADLLKTIFTLSPQEKNRYLKSLRSGKSIPGRYGRVVWNGWWVLKPEYTKQFKRPGFSYDSPKRKKCFEAKEKIILRQTEPTIVATVDTDGYFFPNSIFQIALEKHEHNKLMGILAILNSKFMRFYYSIFSQVAGTTKPQMYLNILKYLPFPDEIPSKFSSLVDEMLALNVQLQESAENSNSWRNIKSSIDKVDKQIDQLVNELYALTPEEIKVLEEG